jgi:catechol 2,3-dioxygenase-like lactoylglutathione lyase family enzyme
MMPTVIAGAHTIVFAEDADAARAFFRDVLGFPAVDAGEGWLIFALPPGELAFHPGPGWGQDLGQHQMFFMCHDIEEAVAELEKKGVEFVAPVADEGYGLVTRLRVPGAGEIGLYEPKHPSPLAEFSDE